MGSMRKSRLSKYKQDRLIEHFVAGTTAQTASSLCGVHGLGTDRFRPLPVHPIVSGNVRPWAILDRLTLKGISSKQQLA
jgi:transposase-like protein